MAGRYQYNHPTSVAGVESILNGDLLAAPESPEYASRAPAARTTSYPPPGTPVRRVDRSATTIAYEGSHRLVVALDYGTTFTGVAFAAPKSNQASLNDITIVQDWGTGMDNNPKIPSVISYTPPGPAGERQFGADLSSEAVTLENTKLELDVQDTRSAELELIMQILDGTNDLSFEGLKESSGLPQYTWKNAEDIMTDYLTKVFKIVDQKLNDIGAHLRSQLPVDIVITTPTEWSYRAKNSTFRAVTRAGFNRQSFPNLSEVLIVTEPEVAAIFTARHLKEDRAEEVLKVNECFILCDAGGGTVDAVSYKVVQLQPTLQLEQVTMATGARCGSTYIDLAFKKWFRRLVGDENFMKLEHRDASEQISAHTVRRERMRDVMDQFEAHKKRFPTHHAPMIVDLPAPLTGLNIPGSVLNGDLTIKPNDMQKIFDPTINKVVELIVGQISQIEKKKSRVKNLFLVGGFGESIYLQRELQRSLNMKNIILRCPSRLKGWTAVVQGAVIYGIEKASLKNKISVKSCAMSYCLVLDDSYSRLHNDAQDLYRDPITNQAMAKSQMHWLVRKGDLLSSEITNKLYRYFSLAFYKKYRSTSKLSVYVYPDDDDAVPERFETGQNELKKIAQLDCDLSNISLDQFELKKVKKGRSYYVANMTCEVQVSGEMLEIKIHHKGTKVCAAWINGLTTKKILQGKRTLSKLLNNQESQPEIPPNNQSRGNRNSSNQWPSRIDIENRLRRETSRPVG